MGRKHLAQYVSKFKINLSAKEMKLINQCMKNRVFFSKYVLEFTVLQQFTKLLVTFEKYLLLVLCFYKSQSRSNIGAYQR